tara:strand:+ start:93 stop:1478 length:1386 start_codon:yes stop_codon:yes gene_type:complete
MKLQRFLAVALVAVFTLGALSLNVANAAGTYKISCKNDAYGMQLGSDYTSVAYVYDHGAAAGSTGNAVPDNYRSYLIGGPKSTYDQAYVGNDCIYAGSGDTNGTAVVAADVARIAVNAIVGAVSNRIDMAYSSKAGSTSATGLSFTTQNDGVSMSANKIIGGLSIWADMANSDFQNTQAFTGIRIDSMKFKGDASSYSVGVDKQLGKAIIGLVVSNMDTDIKTTFNDGTYKQSIDTYGVYVGYRTGVFQIDLGMGEGDSTIDTTRRDLGNDATITGKTTADVEYSNARISATFSRGRFSLIPNASYRTMTMDIKGFTDVRPDDTAANIDNAAGSNGLGQNLFNGGVATLTTTDDTIAGRSVKTKSMDVGVTLSANLGILSPYIGMTYTSEDTTAAVFKQEVGTDGNDAEQLGTNYTSSTHIGGGINFLLGSHVKGGIRMGTINGRNDWDEDYIAGNVSLGF